MSFRDFFQRCALWQPPPPLSLSPIRYNRVKYFLLFKLLLMVCHFIEINSFSFSRVLFRIFHISYDFSDLRYCNSVLSQNPPNNFGPEFSIFTWRQFMTSCFGCINWGPAKESAVYKSNHDILVKVEEACEINYYIRSWGRRGC